MRDNADYVKPALLTAAQLAERLNVSLGWVYRYRGPGRVVLVEGSLVRFDYDRIVTHLEAGTG